MSVEREIYPREWVVDTDGARLSVRNYMEQRDLRQVIAFATKGRALVRAAEFGCGYGRMVQVLTEVAAEVYGFEREQSFVDEASALIPAVNFVQCDELAHTGAADASFDLITSFTFLQHLTDAVAERVVEEMQRCVKPGGHILICEETDEAHQMGDPNDDTRICTIGRSLAKYRALFAPMQLVHVQKREIEPGYERPDTGHYMLFQG